MKFINKDLNFLKALGYSDERATNGIRITFGRQTDKKSIQALLKVLKNTI